MTSTALVESYERLHDRRSEWPQNYTGATIVVGTASQEIRPEEYFYGHAHKFNLAPLLKFQVSGKTYLINKPILIKMNHEENSFFVENDNLVLCGVGNNREEALDDFLMHLEYFYHFYGRQNERDLTGEALRLKQIYNNLFSEI